MRILLLTFGLILVLCTWIGCEDTDLGTIDSTGTAPFLRGGEVSPDSINIDTLVPANGEYTVTTTVQVKVSDPDGQGDIHSVTAEVFRPGGESPFIEASFHDDGAAPDLAAGDSVYSGRVEFTLTRPLAGRYHIDVQARDNAGRRSNGQSLSFYATRRNSIPAVSNLVAPDSIMRPASGFSLHTFSIAAADSDGYDDIEAVFFMRILPDPRPPVFMFDDGNVSLTGDRVAGDGIFTRVVLIDSTAVPGSQVFQFQARDRFGSLSDSTLHTIEILP